LHHILSRVARANADLTLAWALVRSLAMSGPEAAADPIHATGDGAAGADRARSRYHIDRTETLGHGITSVSAAAARLLVPYG
jgi:hypothetical protein